MNARKRRELMMIAGGCIALLGVLIFFGAHAMVRPPTGVSYNPADVDREEILVAVFGMVLVVCGTIVASVGLAAWCGSKEP